MEDRHIDRHMAELGRSLRGPRRLRADLLAEARDGLEDAAAAYREAGLDREDAERRAVADFGPVRLIAPGYQSELGLAEGRRTALLICAVLTAQPVAWWLLDRLFGAGPSGPGGPVFPLVDALARWSGTAAVALALAVACAAGAGLPRRLTPPRLSPRRLVRTAGVLAFAVCGFFAVLGVLMTLTSPATGALLGPTGLPGTLLLLHLPLAAVALAGRRCLAAV
ncbi:permease prefix domain 1-containing protein [Streptomyces lichenis]|uniref:Permease prefix domain 1-containing protein n=1 Tax=Streptomyces lichenis TaxID=2306967 RepID=A0ABT0IAR2_9ACTN|nr:permease prefix domain 1-containing protein [Streptomyces lichenis]MCK8678385.1 permease prefix domain 1-containing protein [Streptomyces lichenis]